MQLKGVASGPGVQGNNSLVPLCHAKDTLPQPLTLFSASLFFICACYICWETREEGKEIINIINPRPMLLR